MSFAALAPLAFALLPLAAAPVIIHLLTRRRATPRAFPALAFLARVEAGRASRHRLRERAVLALRALALICAALAAVGLAWRGSLAGSGRPAVIVLDASASMQQQVDGATVWSRARAAAGRIADEYAGRPLALVVASAPRRATGAPAVTHGPVRALLADAEPGAGDGDPAGALAAALAALAGPGDIVLITDLARGSLAGIDPRALPTGVALRLVDAGGGAANCAVVGLAAEPGTLVAGRPATILARVANYGVAPATLSIALRAGSASGVTPLTLGAGESAVVRQTLTLDSTGWIAIEAELIQARADALPLDDRRVGAVEVVPALAALVVSDADRGDPAGVVRPLVAALSAAGLAVRVSDGAGLAAELAGEGGRLRPALVVTAALADPAPVRAALPGHLDGGGAWLQVVCGDADAALGDVGGIVAPAPLGAPVDVSAQERGEMRLGQAKLEHALLAPFVGRESLLASVAAYRYRLTPTGAAADAATLWAWADGTLALIERPARAGRWLLLNGSPAAADSNLAAGEVLPLLAERLPAVLLPARSDRLARDVGGRVPAGGPLTDATGRALPVVDGSVLLDRPGLYRAAGGALLAAAVPALESDLRRLDPARLDLTASDAASTQAEARLAPLWPWLLVAVALMLGLELLLAGGLPGRVGGRRP